MRSSSILEGLRVRSHVRERSVVLIEQHRGSRFGVPCHQLRVPRRKVEPCLNRISVGRRDNPVKRDPIPARDIHGLKILLKIEELRADQSHDLDVRRVLGKDAMEVTRENRVAGLFAPFGVTERSVGVVIGVWSRRVEPIPDFVRILKVNLEARIKQSRECLRHCGNVGVGSVVRAEIPRIPPGQVAQLDMSPKPCRLSGRGSRVGWPVNGTVRHVGVAPAREAVGGEFADLGQILWREGLRGIVAHPVNPYVPQVVR